MSSPSLILFISLYKYKGYFSYLLREWRQEPFPQQTISPGAPHKSCIKLGRDLCLSSLDLHFTILYITKPELLGIDFVLERLNHFLYEDVWGVKKINGCNKNKSALALLVNVCYLVYGLIQAPSPQKLWRPERQNSNKNDSGEERKGRGKEGKMSFQMSSENRWGTTEAQRFIVLAEIALNRLLKAAHLLLSHCLS